MEEDENIIELCEECHDDIYKPIKKMIKKIKIKVGDIVKKGWKSVDGTNEYMWVEITKIIDKKTFEGILGNEPVLEFDYELSLGDMVIVKKEEIIDIFGFITNQVPEKVFRFESYHVHQLEKTKIGDNMKIIVVLEEPPEKEAGDYLKLLFKDKKGHEEHIWCKLIDKSNYPYWVLKLENDMIYKLRYKGKKLPKDKEFTIDYRDTKQAGLVKANNPDVLYIPPNMIWLYQELIDAGIPIKYDSKRIIH